MNLTPQPGKPLHPVEIENELIRLGNELETLTEELGKQGESVGRWEVDYKRARAKARLRSDKKSGEDRDAEAVLASIGEYESFRAGSAIYDAMRDRSYTIRVQIEILRTIAANVRAQT